MKSFKVRFNGCYSKWGNNDDPKELLVVGLIYTVIDEDVRSCTRSIN